MAKCSDTLSNKEMEIIQKEEDKMKDLKVIGILIAVIGGAVAAIGGLLVGGAGDVHHCIIGALVALIGGLIAGIGGRVSRIGMG
jgi:hypothetical protein